MSKPGAGSTPDKKNYSAEIDAAGISLADATVPVRPATYVYERRTSGDLREITTTQLEHFQRIVNGMAPRAGLKLEIAADLSADVISKVLKRGKEEPDFLRQPITSYMLRSVTNAIKDYYKKS